MSHELEITSSCSPAEYTAALEKLLAREAAPAEGEPAKKGMIHGRIQGHKVTLYTRSWGNDYAPVFSGEILSANGGMILRGNFRHPTMVRIQLLLFRSFAVVFSTVFLAAILYAAHANRTFDLKITFALLIPIALTGGILFGSSRISRIDPEPLRKFIHRSIPSSVSAPEHQESIPR